jgi:hypothetical protein
MGASGAPPGQGALDIGPSVRYEAEQRSLPFFNRLLVPIGIDVQPVNCVRALGFAEP